MCQLFVTKEFASPAIRSVYLHVICNCGGIHA